MKLDQVLEIKEAIFALLKQSGKAIMDYYHQQEDSWEIDFKSDDSPLTKADLASNDIITLGLKKWTPHIPLISEESPLLPYSERKEWEYVWLLDPLDGTKEFINRTDEFSINLALIEHGQVILGFIYLPVQDIIYYAAKAYGAFTVDQNGEKQVFASTFTMTKKHMNVVSSRSHMDKETLSFIENLNEPNIIIKGSALKFLSIASGEADYYPRMIHIMEWDTAAGQIIIEEAGGSLVDAHTNKPLEYNKPSMRNPMFIASGKVIEA